MIRKLLFLPLFTVCLIPVNAQNKPYPTKVFDYCPAPGQFVHELPAYEEGDTPETMAGKCLDSFNDGNIISLGGYGGYITIGFDHTILNVPDKKDFMVLGNAFDGSAEPGIVMVSEDTNRDGLPNDEWYELAGSEYTNPATVHNYEITYSRPAGEAQDVPWTDNQKNEGVVKYMGKIIIPGHVYYHTHPHYPKWITQDKLTFQGTRIPDNGSYDEKKEMWVMKSYPYGYADNYPNNNIEGCSFNIEWAVNNKGEKVNLSGIDFIRIYTAVNQQVAGGVGELSTEVSDVQDLHPNSTNILSSSFLPVNIFYKNGSLFIETSDICTVTIYNLQGEVLSQWLHDTHTSTTTLSLPKGIYIIQAGSTNQKLIIQ